MTPYVNTSDAPAVLCPERNMVALWRSLARPAHAWLREPLLHFFVLGTALFLVWPLIAERVAPPSNQIVISQGQMQQVVERFARTHLRPPSPDELEGLAEQQVRSEVYYREGVALGLDRDDEIIRRRVVQKVEFMTQDIADQGVPSDAELQRYLDSHRDDFGGEDQIALSQIYLNPDRHRAALAADAARLLARLNAGDGRLNYGVDSDVLPVPNDFEAQPLHIIARTFGDEFAASVSAQSPGRWVGPIRSGYGFHLVLVRERRQGSPPQLPQVRDAVLREWQSAHRVLSNNRVYRQMRSKYSIKIEPAAVSQGTPRAVP
jgi:PPIC-type PPIASE domain